MNVPKWAKERGKVVARRVPFAMLEPALFPAEGAWLRLGRKSPGLDDASVIFFSLHKVASSFTHHMVSYLNTELMGLRRMNWDGYAYNRFETSAAEWVEENKAEIFESKGYCYGVFRAPVEMNNFADYRKLAIFRDPRDILTSWYFSDAYSHAEPLNRGRVESFQEGREEVQSLDINTYVLGERAAYLETQLAGYRTLFQTYNVTPLLYETMQQDWHLFMDQVEAQLAITISPAHRKKLQAMGGIGESLGDDVSQHRRKGTPGDYAEKLDGEAVEALNDRFGTYIEWLGIPL